MLPQLGSQFQVRRLPASPSLSLARAPSSISASDPLRQFRLVKSGFQLPSKRKQRSIYDADESRDRSMAAGKSLLTSACGCEVLTVFFVNGY